MENFFKDLNSAYWWVSVVVVSLLLNLASSYLKSAIDIIFGSISKKRRARNEAQRLALELESSTLANDLQLLNIEIGLQTRDIVLSLELLALAALLSGILVLLAPYSLNASIPKFVAGIVIAITVLILFLLSNVLSMKAMSRIEVITLARQKIRGRGDA